MRLINPTQNLFHMDEAATRKQENELKKQDKNNCLTSRGGYYHNHGVTQFKESSFLKSTFLALETYLEIQEPGAIAFEIRQFPEPLEIGKTTGTVPMYDSAVRIECVCIIQFCFQLLLTMNTQIGSKSTFQGRHKKGHLKLSHIARKSQNSHLTLKAEAQHMN